MVSIQQQIIQNLSFMFENSLRQLLITISQFEQKLQSYRQLLNQQIQFNIKDMYIRISGNNSQVTAYHLHVFVTQKENQEHNIDRSLLESVIKGYNNCSSMNLSFIQFALIFLSRQNRLLAKLALERNSLGDIPQYLCDYSRKILIIQCELHGCLMQFRKNNSISAEKWIKQNSLINQQSGQQVFEQQKLRDICNGIEIEYETISRYFKSNDKEALKCQKMLSLLTLKNCKKLSEYLKKVQNTKSQIDFKNNKDPYIRPEFHDCLERPKALQNFSFRQIKSIQKHLERLNSKNKNQLEQKINHYRKYIEKQLKIVAQAINDIICLEKQIQFQRIQLCLCTDFYPILFFDSFIKDRQQYLIPSNFQSYLEKLGVKIQINNLYTIFKRYSTRADGKLNFNQFCSMFDVCNTQYTHIEKNRQIRSLEDIQIQTIKTFLKLIKSLSKNEAKIQKIKSKLQTEVELRQIFYVFDSDEDGYISMLDFRVVWKKFLLMELKQQQILLFWHRMKLPKDPNNMIRYQKFMSQMVPKSPWIQKNVKLKNKSRTTK